MNNSSVVKKTTTEWDIFRTEQLAILKEIKKRTGEYISGKGNVMKYIGELWRIKKIDKIINKSSLNHMDARIINNILLKNNKKTSIIDANGCCVYIKKGKPERKAVIIYV